MRSHPVPATSRKRAPVAFPTLELAKLEMLFADGQRVWLYQVGSDWLARAIKSTDGTLQVDLRDMLPADVEADMMDASLHDRAAILFFELRKRFKTADAFVQAVQEVCAPVEQRLAA